MKKFLSVAVALGMVAGVATAASALELKVKGTYKVDGYWLKNADEVGVIPFKVIGGDDNSDSDWYQHTFRLNTDLIVNDKITVRGDIRMIDSNTVWGDGAFGDGGGSNGNRFDVDKLWLVYDSPVGKFEIGRRPAGAWGLPFVSSSTNATRIFWHLPTGDGPFKAYAFLQKIQEDDLGNGDSDGPLVSGFNGADADYYEIGAGHKADNLTVYGGIGTRQDDTIGQSLWRAKVWGKVGVGPGNILFEGDYKFGENSETVDYDSYAFFLGFAGDAGNISYNVFWATISGDNKADDDENEAYDATHGTGDDFEPLYIMTGNRTNVLNGDRGGTNVIRQSGVNLLAATADFKASEDLTLHGGVGWGMAHKEPDAWDDSYGWELNAGLAYKLYQNLNYELHFGYWFVGDFAELGGIAETDDVMLLSHHLTMKF